VMSRKDEGHAGALERTVARAAHPEGEKYR
jgi:hypothetical protein